jgi:hypothetical protein
MTDPQPLDLDAIRSAVAATFDQFEPAETRQARWEAAALAAGREVDRNALRAYMAVADAEQQALADDWAKSAAAADDEIRRLRAELAAEQAQHAFTLRQRNNRSQRLLHLRDLANAGNTEALVAAAQDTLAASINDHQSAAEEAHVVADDSDDPEHVDDCPGCEATVSEDSR